MPDGLIDLWNPETFDVGLFAELRCEAEMMRDYFVTERANYEAYKRIELYLGGVNFRRLSTAEQAAVRLTEMAGRTRDSMKSAARA